MEGNVVADKNVQDKLCIEIQRLNCQLKLCNEQLIKYHTDNLNMKSEFVEREHNYLKRINQLSDLSNQITHVNSTIESNIKKISKMTKIQEEFKEEVNKAKECNEQLKKSLDEKDQIIVMANKKIMELKKQIDEVENSYSNKITELNKNLLKLEKENEQKQNKIDELNRFIGMENIQDNKLLALMKNSQF